MSNPFRAIGGANHEREFPIPGIPGNTGLQFPSRKSGMEFSTPIPVPEKGNKILWIFHSRSRYWEWNIKVGKSTFFRDILYFRQSKSKYMIQHQRIIVKTYDSLLNKKVQKD